MHISAPLLAALDCHPGNPHARLRVTDIFYRQGHRTFKQRLGPPEPRQVSIAPRVHPVNPPASQPATRAFRPETHPLNTPLHRSDPATASEPPPRAPTHAPSQPPPPSGGARAAANSGASNGNPRARQRAPIARSTRSIEFGSWMAASSRRTPPQFGHENISTRKTRRSNVAHV